VNYPFKVIFFRYTSFAF